MVQHTPSHLSVSTLVVFELLRGAAALGAARRQALERFVEGFPVFSFEVRDAHHAADIDANLRRAGQPIGPLDTLIAGTARARGLTLVTRNTSEFARVPGLMIENWF